MTHDPPRLLTIGKIADDLCVPTHRIRYIIKTRLIQPVAYAGSYALYDREAFVCIRYELDAIEARRQKSAG